VGLVVYCADIGSVPNKRFGWARTTADSNGTEIHASGPDIDELLGCVAEDLGRGKRVALGFECPLFVPVPNDPLALGKARCGEEDRPWSAGAGSGAMATGLTQVAWVLSGLRPLVPDATDLYLDWPSFKTAKRGLFLWEAFVSGKAKAQAKDNVDPHVQDARAAVREFRALLPDLHEASAVTSKRPLSLVGAAVLWSGWATDLALLRSACLVIKVQALSDRAA
jgi:hypothetical protein